MTGTIYCRLNSEITYFKPGIISGYCVELPSRWALAKVVLFVKCVNIKHMTLRGQRVPIIKYVMVVEPIAYSMYFD